MGFTSASTGTPCFGIGTGSAFSFPLSAVEMRESRMPARRLASSDRSDLSALTMSAAATTRPRRKMTCVLYTRAPPSRSNLIATRSPWDSPTICTLKVETVSTCTP